ncbi:hypothetical protein M406DRAFT_286769 [Cryphonectria parasitica EP155]|uniref:Glycoside hydrolase family 43 protein n=1 Tax=Cryphonectria parasitica (strain ATCC 38755 / EP155) TaxID=660469 RepID=A0A9P4Y8N5_CRYP1|nr:uncharacterized protein M406DRAFT_286769 [Cryphonectria parasitica EP155]KAF3768781.1 hypothetical protein M406DRAFT_286769 [Cryphonectria parasitica EP155]
MLTTFLTLLAALALAATVTAQGDTLGLADGFLSFSTQNFDLELVKDAQVLVSLKASGGTFDFLPLGYLSVRAGNGQYHWGDVTFRYRTVGSTTWIDGDSSQARNPVASVSTASNSTVLAASNMAATLPSDTAGLGVTREWLDVDGDLGLSFTLTNNASTSIELGSLGFPAEFNNIFTNYTAEETQEYCSLSDPYIGMHAGYIRVSPINGNGAALVVTPLGDTPLEAYRNLDEPYYDSTAYESQVFEGLYEWQTLTEAWAENEWNASEPWNTPSSKVLAPGEALTFGLKFSLADGGIETIDDEVQAQGVPYARGIPGFILPADLTGQLLVNPGSAGDIANITVDPAGALTVTEGSSSGEYDVTPSSSAFGRARLTIAYTSGQVQTVHYYVVKSGPDHIAALSNFLTTEQYYTNTSDPFGRAPSVISYDYSVMAPVLQDMRVWIAGLSDEAGAGSFLAASMKQAAQPNADEIAKLEDFVAQVLYKTLQPPQNGTYDVRMSIFYYGLAGYPYSSAIDWTTWESWTEPEAYATDRAYDYVHVAASYWGLYRAGRAYEGILTQQPWDWYLNQSYNTVMSAMAQDSEGNWLVGYSTDGLMGETVFGELLKDLTREGWTTQAAALEAKMRARAELWSTMDDPFGSEMAWDSTGQEGVYYWSKYFGYNSTAEKTLATVLGFQPTVAHWGWNGNARRYWDFIYGGKLERIERQIHHYGSGLNALVALSAFRSNPNDTYLLRIGYGGMNGPLSNIRADGCASAAFHSWPETLQWDAYSGDYGPNHSGLVMGTGTYLAWDAELGRLVAYGGLLDDDGAGTVTVSPRDVARRKVFVGPIGLLVEVDAGVIESFAYTTANASLVVTLGQLDGVPTTNSTVMWLSREEGDAGYEVTGTSVTEARLGWQIPLGSGSVSVNIVPS